MPCSTRTYIPTHRPGQAHTPLICTCMEHTLAAWELHGNRHRFLTPAWASTPDTGALHGMRSSSSGSGMLVTEAAASKAASTS